MPEKITIFEPHFHDAQIGPTVMSGDSEDEETMATEDEMDDESGGFGKLKLLLLAAVVTAIGVAVYRKVSGDDGFEIEVEEYETEDPPTTE